MSASMEYSRTSWAWSIAALESVAIRAAKNAAERRTPTRGKRKSNTKTVPVLAAAGTRRTLNGELSTF